MIKSVFFFFSGFISGDQKGKTANFLWNLACFPARDLQYPVFAGIWKNKENVEKTANFLKLSWRGVVEICLAGIQPSLWYRSIACR